MRPFRPARAALALGAVAALAVPEASLAGRRRSGPDNHEAVGFQTFTSPQSNPLALSPDGTRLYVANTTSGTVSVINTASSAVAATVPVGLEPVSVAVRPDGLEVWVSNHVSDSVSVIDTNPASPTLHRVIETIQEFDAAGATLFDEPVGIAFASNSKAYVALSSRDVVAVVDATTYEVTGRIHVTAQEPRAIAVRNGLLYVAAFESGNRTELTGLSLADLANFATNPNLPGTNKVIGTHANHPDRDLFVYDTSTDLLVDAETGIGTLLYGLAVSSTGQAFITQTSARNGFNGAHGSVLADLDNRLFLDEVARVGCSAGGCSGVTRFDLHAATPPPAHPAPGDELSTPYGIAISGNDQWLVGTSAGNSRLFIMTAAGAVRARLDLGSGASFGRQIPRGVALRSDGSGNPQRAYVLNTLENTVAVVNVAINPDPAPPTLTLVSKIGVGADPTPTAVRLGAIAFNSSFASSSGTFSCGSCHPDGNTDQLLWRIGGACPDIGCGEGDEPRVTMPIRGLKDTLPLHWDGTLGDPVGGPNGAIGRDASIDASCDAGGADGDHDCFAHLVAASLSGVMCDQTDGCDLGPTGLPGLLTAQERSDMATFLASVSYPPARGRRMNDKVSGTGIYDAVPAVDPVTLTNPVTGESAQVNALEGFKDFFTNQGGNTSDPDTCADSTAGCHALPLGAATNSFTLQGFDAPTMRGLTDRFVQFSLAPTGSVPILNTANGGLSGIAVPLELPIRWSTAEGMQEISTFGAAFLVFESVYATRPLNLFQSFEEASTQFPGAAGRQVTLNARTTAGGLLAESEAILAALEEADLDGMVNLRGVGLRDNGAGLIATTLSFRSDGTYKDQANALSRTRSQLIEEAQAGGLVMTFTAALRSGYGVDGQPLLTPPTSGGCTNCGDPAIPSIASTTADPPAFNVTAAKLTADASVVWDGAGVAGATLTCASGGTFPSCTGGQVAVNLPSPRPANGMHLLQVRNGDGPLSNELPVCVRNSTTNTNTAVCR
jgi:YVTN family beta-propeller protein